MTAQCSLIQKELEKRIVYLAPLLKLANTHMVDYFTQSTFAEVIPREIQQEVEELGEEAIINLIFKNDLTQAPFLRRFFDNNKSYMLKNCKPLCLSTNEFQEKLKQFGGRRVSGLKLEVFMNSKKSHEVEVLSALVATIRNVAKTSHVIDIGDGKGYLSSTVALHHKIPVLGVDASKANTNGAVKRVKNLSKVWNSVVSTNKTQETSLHLYKQVTQFVNENVDFYRLVSDVFLEKPRGLSLVGLHTCGDLSPSSIKIFHTSEHMRTICNVGCCYHLLTEAYDDLDPQNNSSEGGFGFPMSQFLHGKKYSVGRAGRMIAAQSVERILDKKELPNKTIFYRAILEKLLENYDGVLGNKHVGRCRSGCDSFLGYVRSALKRLGSDVVIPDQEINEIYTRYEGRLSELNLFYLIRNMLAPVIESLILLDRLLFLHEQGYSNAFLVQLFDPVVSPRCYGIIALK